VTVTRRVRAYGSAAKATATLPAIGLTGTISTISTISAPRKLSGSSSPRRLATKVGSVAHSVLERSHYPLMIVPHGLFLTGARADESAEVPSAGR